MKTEVNLRDYLLAGLSSSGIPGRRNFHLHVLVGGERRCGTLFPYATGGKVRVGVREVVVILSEETLKGGRVITCGIEAALYRIPQTSSGILYVSKVDSTGHGMKPSVTGVLVRRFVGFFVDETARNGWMGGGGVRNMWVHVFARAQGEYLFLGSKEWAGKRVLGDVGLCGWWKRCLGDVGGTDGVRRWYVMPGLSESEAEAALRETGAGWEYGHPYGQTDVPLPCPEGGGRLGRVIPCFEDDAKSRFMDELANDEGGVLRSPERKKRRLDGESKPRAAGELGRVGVDEFWERMGFRQECVAGAVTGFYTVLAWGGGGGEEAIGKPRRGEVSDKMVQRVVGLLRSGGIDFGTAERAERATEVVESTVRGLCEGMPYTPEPGEREKTPERRTGPVVTLTPNPFPEPVASLGTYEEYVYGRTATAGSGTVVTPAQTSHVTQLVARRKARK